MVRTCSPNIPLLDTADGLVFAKVYFNILDPAGRRPAFEEEPIRPGKFGIETVEMIQHGLSEFLARGWLVKQHFATLQHQADGVSGYTQPDFNLRADGDVFDKLTQGIDKFIRQGLSIVTAGIKAQTPADDNGWF